MRQNRTLDRRSSRLRSGRVSANELARRSGFTGMEALERREHLSLAGVSLTQFPRGAYDATGVTTYDAASQSFDVAASPTSIRFDGASAPVTVTGFHGDVQIHAKVSNTGALIRGVTSSDVALNGSINAAGDDLVIIGSIDADGDTIPEYSGVLLTGEIYDFGSFDSGGNTDAFDFRFIPTGGALLALFPAGTDIGVTMSAEHSSFTGSFGENFDGGAKGSYGPIEAPAASSVAGNVYCDEDSSGSLTAGDEPLAGVPVFLDGVNHAGQAVHLSTFTAPNGTYSFPGLRPGTYAISETSPANTVEGTNTIGTANGAIVNEDTIGSIVLAAGVDATGYNFGYICHGSISGKKYTDITGNGLTADDTALGGTTIYIDANDNGSLDSGEASTVTGPDGSYHFDDLDPGTYIVREVVPAGYVRTTPSTGRYSVNVTAGADAGGNNFANTALGRISGFKFNDITANGLSNDDTPLANVLIYIDTNNNSSVDSGEAFTYTAADGSYSFDNLLPGTYIVREIVPFGSLRTGPGGDGSYSVTLTSGQQAGPFNFANTKLVSVSGVKFNDITGNGLTGDDTPLAGVTIYIDANNNGSLDTGETSATTAADGSYTFSSLLAGTYVIREVVAVGSVRTTPSPSDNYVVTLTSGQTASGKNFANTTLVSISGKKYKDITGNGVTADDTGLAGTTIYIDTNNNGSKDSGEPSTVTDADGSYSFTGLLPGTYVVREVVPAGWTRTAPNTGLYSVTLNSGESASGKNFANTQVGSISGKKYKDLTGNGVSADDTGLAGTTIYIDANNNGSLDSGETSTVSAADGSFSFTGLLPGTYVIREVVPAGWTRTAPNTGQYSITLTTGQASTGNNFANTQAVSISGKKYKDLTGNGLTSDDTGLSGTTIYLDLNSNGSLDSGEPSTVSGSDGSFAFNGLNPGTYIVREVMPAGYYRTTPSATDNYTITLSSGQAATGKNFANAPFARLSGKKFLDGTGNGLTSDDGPLSGVVVYIDANNNGVKDANERSTTTAADGTYAFENLAPGTYIVREVVPDGYVRTGPTLTDNYSVALTNGQTVSGLNFANAETCDLSIVSNVQYSINNCTVVTDLRGNTHSGDTITVTFTIAPGHDPHQFTLVSYTAPGATFDANTASQQVIFDSDTGTFGPGTWTLTVSIPDCYYQIDFVCGAAIDRLGPAGSNIFYGAQSRLISADNGGTVSCTNRCASIAGTVWLDNDNDGLIDNGEAKIGGVKITLTWTEGGSAKSAIRYTGADGTYRFTNLTSGLVYKVTEAQPSGYTDGKDAVGSAGGTLGNDVLSGITLGGNVNAVNYNFGERSANDTCGSRETAACSFWCGTSGQNLIKSFNGGSTAMNLGMHLGSMFPRLFGDSAGSMNLKGKTNAQIAAAMVTRNASSSTNVEAQTLALALSEYASTSFLAGGTMATGYGFTVSNAGTGWSFNNVGTNGSLLGLANSSSQTILSVLAGLDSKAMSGNGMVYNGNSSSRTTLFNYVRGVNALGGL